jgi:hypothetical protein
LTEQQLAEIEARARAATGDRWEVVADRDAASVVHATSAEGDKHLRITREAEPAASNDVEFIGNARRDVHRLVAGLRGPDRLSGDELDEIQRRCDGASPAPWRAFLEDDGGIGGCNVIWVSDSDDEPDLYLWLGSEIASGADFEFVAAVRQDIPDLLAATRRRHERG